MSEKQPHVQKNLNIRKQTAVIYNPSPVNLFVCVEVLQPSQQLKSCQAGQLPINTVPGQA